MNADCAKMQGRKENREQAQKCPDHLKVIKVIHKDLILEKI